MTQFLTLQTSNLTMTQNVLNRVHSISANHRDPENTKDTKEGKSLDTKRGR